MTSRDTDNNKVLNYNRLICFNLPFLPKKDSGDDEGETDPRVVFFPTSPENAGPSGCQDGDGGGGFNTFAFLSFLLSAVNAVR